MHKAKIATSIFFTLGLMLLLSMPWVLAKKPIADAPSRDVKVFAVMFTIYCMLLLLVFFGTVISAWILVRKQREAFREASMANLKDLIEGTLNDHGRTQDS